MANIAVGYLYFVCLGAAFPFIADALRAGRISAPAVFAISAIAFLVLPALYAPGTCRVSLVIVGWDAALSAYSYCIETSRAPRPGTKLFVRVEDCLFFLFVNPVLVYVRRGSKARPAGFEAKGSAHISKGLLSLVLAMAVISPASRLFESYVTRSASSLHAASLAGAQTLAAIASIAVLRFAVEYSMQSGLAELQIGMMRQLGHDIPERFKQPLLATDPLDFWRRWNLYVGEWIQRYVFWPFALELGKYRNSLRSLRGKAIALLVAFATSGLLHDGVLYLEDAHSHYRGSIVFVIAAGLVMVWHVAKRQRTPVPAGSLGPIVTREVSRAAFWCSTLALFLWWNK
ncbi:MAG TPA: MBOAT family O-acyltransferase [Polyangiaceae bacterium]|nr:MBOAT family O-acyltransferase [Polyangiaceae bacterium]